MKPLRSPEFLIGLVGFVFGVLALIGLDLTCRPIKDFCYGFADFQQLALVAIVGVVSGAMCVGLRKIHFPLLSGAEVKLPFMIFVPAVFGLVLGALFFSALSV